MYLRGPGLVELAREMAKANRSAEPLVLAFVDVVGLKSVNDLLGHAAGDRVLMDVAEALQSSLRSYDLIVRYGGDEFVCVLQGLSLAEARTRLGQVNEGLGHLSEHTSVTIGLTQMKPEDSPEDIVARADADLYQQRQARLTSKHAQCPGSHMRPGREACAYDLLARARLDVVIRELGSEG